MVRRLTTSDFVTKARSVHGDLYDYSKTEYVRSGDKLEIHCRVLNHGPFWMTPDNHTHKTSPQGCPKCGREKAGKARTKTTEEFLIEIREVHGERYGLHLVDYKSAKEKVVLVCDEHGEFPIAPDSILSKGSGCWDCGILKRSRNRATPELGESLLDKHPELCKEWSSFNSNSPAECNPGSSRNAFWVCQSCSNEWWAPINARVNGRGCRVCKKGRLHSSGNNSMFHTNPEFASELLPNKHGTAMSLTSGTNILLPWKCSACEHEWYASGASRKSGSGCAVCNAGHLHSRGDNAMAITHPHLATELLPNNFGRAEEMVAGTKNKLPWKCSICEHQWEAQGWSRAYQGTGCPACSNKGLHSDGSNSMAVTHPRLARELMANEYGTAEELIAGTSKRLPWKCSICEHQWETTGNNRTISSNCPACVNQEFHSSGLNSIASKLPEIAHELLPNPHGTAETLIYVTGINLPWKCSTCGHEWKTTGRNRERGSGCGPCNRGGLKSDGSNSMILTHPYLAKELLPNRHGDSNTLIATTNKKLPWKCLACGFEWITSGAHRVYDGTGCSQCATHGFQPHLPAQYYVHEILNSFGDVIYYKGGISGDWVIRLTRLKSDLPDHLSYNNIEVVHFNHGDDARELERNLLEVEAIRAPKRDFSGGTELFTSNPLEYARELNLLQPDK